ncbi:MAG TPA: DUF3388 domain-containing protein [Pseudogracilibacillus sp.]|nr:DUF3388 domain-containing protein [Pseudogracilibacillus sp.]
MEMKEWYLEYKLENNRPGLLGDISTLLGMLSINIIMINSVDNNRRGLLILSEDDDNIKRLQSILKHVDTVDVTKLQKPDLLDKLAVRHGKYIHRDSKEQKTIHFVRGEFGILVDFMSEIFKSEGHKLIGVRGMPRVGKSEAIVAGSVSANKKWLFVSSTLLKQTVRNELIMGEYSEDYIYIIDGVVSQKHAGEKHWQLIREIMQIPTAKVIEHPDIFIQQTQYTMDDFDYIIEIRRNEDEEITYEPIEKNPMNGGFSMFDF